jgi:hypothetical protein
MFSLGGSTPRLMVDIERGAGLTIREGVRLAALREFPHEEERDAA